MENEILAIAQQLTQQGKMPSVALVKAKLSRRVPMPLIIQTLQRFSTMPAKQQQAIERPTADVCASENPLDLAQQVTTLTEQVTTLETKFAALQHAFTQHVNTLGK